MSAYEVILELLAYLDQHPGSLTWVQVNECYRAEWFLLALDAHRPFDVAGPHARQHPNGARVVVEFTGAWPGPEVDQSWWVCTAAQLASHPSRSGATLALVGAP